MLCNINDELVRGIAITVRSVPDSKKRRTINPWSNDETGDGVRPICTADALYGLVLVLDLRLMTKILLSHFLIGLKQFHVKSGR